MRNRLMLMQRLVDYIFKLLMNINLEFINHNQDNLRVRVYTAIILS